MRQELPWDNGLGEQARKVGPTEDSKKPAWHRVGWVSKKQQLGDPRPREAAGATLAPQPPRRYGGPVVRHTHTHTFAHAQMQQHTHKTVLQRSWCPGLAGVPLTEPNYGAFLSELDMRLLKAHNTMAAVRDKSRAHTQQQINLSQQQQHQQLQQQQQHHHQPPRQQEQDHQTGTGHQQPQQHYSGQQHHQPQQYYSNQYGDNSNLSGGDVPAASSSVAEGHVLDTVALRRAVNVK